MLPASATAGRGSCSDLWLWIGLLRTAQLGLACVYGGTQSPLSHVMSTRSCHRPPLSFSVCWKPGSCCPANYAYAREGPGCPKHGSSGKTVSKTFARITVSCHFSMRYHAASMTKLPLRRFTKASVNNKSSKPCSCQLGAKGWPKYGKPKACQT